MLKTIKKKLEETGSTWLEVKTITPALQKEIEKKKVILRKKNQKQYITLSSIDFWEKEVASKLSTLAAITYPTDEEEINRLIAKFEEENRIELDEKQKEAVHMMMRSKFCVLTGGPGTGKTSVLKCASDCFRHYGLTRKFAAPTGKAAHRITESVGLWASTIQRAMGYNPSVPYINQITADVLIIDEASMIDMETMYLITLALHPKTRLILVGDENQLPSVQIGSVLKDLLQTGGSDGNFIPNVQLTKTFRQTNDSTLFENIQIINQGAFVPLKEGKDFVILPEPKPKEMIELCVNQYMENIAEYGIENTAILLPYRKAGKVNSNILNRKIQEKINKKGEKPYLEVSVFRDETYLKIRFQEGDPVIHLKNNAFVANGDTGTVISVDTMNRCITVQYEDCKYTYKEDKHDFNELDLAYAISINKSQGSEYACAICPFFSEFTNLDRNMIYTAVTRAKKKCVVIGNYDTIKEKCQILSTWDRTTFLPEELEIGRKKLLICQAALSV